MAQTILVADDDPHLREVVTSEAAERCVVGSSN